jgi:glycosyltransferase involved in cell wall biosynthesis
MGFYFYPRGGSAIACDAIATELADNGLDVRLVAGSRSDIGDHGSAPEFFRHSDLWPVDFTAALGSRDPLVFRGGPGEAPMHASYEDRPGAEDPVMASLDRNHYEGQVAAWADALTRAAGDDHIDVLYLHHLTPVNEAAARVLPEVPVIGHIHGSELAMLERIAHGPPASWKAASSWAERMCDWASACTRIVVNSAQGLHRASAVLEIDLDRFLLVPNGFSPEFAPRAVDRAAHWHRHLVDRPRGWAPGGAPGSVEYDEAELPAPEATTLLSVGRFTEVKRLPLLIEAFVAARPGFDRETALVLLGGFPREWEGEHPLETIERTGATDVFLAGWHPHDSLPEFLGASDVLVHPSVNEQFGQVVVEAMACGLPPIAVDRGGPADIVDSGETGWLIPPDDLGALVEAMHAAVNDGAERRRRGRAARVEALASYDWGPIGNRLAELVRETASQYAARI